MRDVNFKREEKRKRKKNIVANVITYIIFTIIFLILLFIVLKFRGKEKSCIYDGLYVKSNYCDYFLNDKQGKLNINARYPIFDDENINTKIKDIVNNIIDSSKAKNNLNISYNQYGINDSYISLQLIISSDENIEIKDYNFDKETSNELKISDLIKSNKNDEFNKRLNDKISSCGINDKVKDVNDYAIVLKNNNIEIDFNSSVKVSQFNEYPAIYFSYNELKDILVDNLLSIVNYSSIYTLEEVEIPQEVDDGLSISINSGKKLIALTFDDGPHATFTNEILNTLKKYNSSATFFVLGSRAEKYPNILKNIVESGSEIGNHSWSHPQLTKLSIQAMKNEINNTQNVVYNATHTYPKFVRPPYGSINASVKQNIGKPMILWNVDTLDWKTKNTQMILNEIMKNARDGSIILMHDIHQTSKEAVILAIPKLKEKGFELVTVSEMFKAKGVKLEVGKSYTNL